MYRELVEECKGDISHVKIAPPCDEKELRKAEKYIGYAFPDELKALLREMNGDGYFLLSTEQMIENVRLNREYFPECFDSEKEFFEKVDGFIFFATNGCGDYYGYRVNDEHVADTSKIYIWEHETFEHKEVARDIADAVKKYYGDEI